MASMARARIAVVGGGISGLAAAWFLRRSLGEAAEVVVCEKGQQIGGHLRVSEVAGMPVDEGAESLLARRPEAVDLVRATGLSADLVSPAPAGADIWSRGRMWPLPAGTVMGVPDDPRSLAGLLTGAEIAFAASADADTGPGMPIYDDVAIGTLVGQRLGPAVVDRLVEPLLGGVYAGHADELSLDATVPALGAAAREHQTLAAAVSAVRSSTDPAPSGVFVGVDGGVGRLPAAVARAASPAVRTCTTVRELGRTDVGWRLTTGPVPSPEHIDVDAVIVATPAAATARLLGEAAPAAAAELVGVETASMAIVTLAVPRSAFPAPPVTSGFLVPPIEGRAVKAVTYSSVKWPWLAKRAGDLVLLRASIGRHREARDLQRDDAELVEAVLGDLREAVGLAGGPVDTRVTRWGGALPQYAVGHVQRVERIRAAVAAVPGLAVCGSTYDGVGVAACVASARAAADAVVAHLSGPTGRRARIEA